MKHFYAIIISVLHLCSGQSLSPEECKNLGFIKSDLLCSSCDDLARFKVSSSITSACRNCCNDDGRKLDEGTTKYPKAILEVCGYSGLTIKYVRGADPIIKLLDDDESVIETLAIDKWNTDSVEEFLDIYLIKETNNETP